MKISELVNALQHILASRGDMDVNLQDAPRSPGDDYMSYENFFVVPEQYEEKWICNIRSWPY